MIGIISLIIILIYAIVIFLVAWLLRKWTHGSSTNGFGINIESPEKRAGRMGEQFAGAVIQEVLRDDDILFRNVAIYADEMPAEIDNLIINDGGIYVIEVKNYYGELYGSEDDNEWIKTRMTPGGVFYQKTLRNPVKQVKRQVYVLSRFLKENGINAWINGYVFFVQNNSPIDSPCVLKTQYDVNLAIHGNIGNAISEEELEKIRKLFCCGK